MRVSLTGTPGTGKTEAANILTARGYDVISVIDLAEKFGAAVEDGGETEIDVAGLASALRETDTTIVIEGHLAHHLPNDACIVLRCHPEVLRERLGNREYSDEKLRENMEAEAIDLILVEAVEAGGRVFEVDTTQLSPAEVAEAIENIIKGKGDGFPPGSVDWSQAVLDWY